MIITIHNLVYENDIFILKIQSEINIKKSTTSNDNLTAKACLNGQ